MRFHIPLCLALFSTTAPAADPTPGVLPPEEFAAGWVSLFDGATDFGWAVEGDVAVKDGKLVVGTSKPSSVTATADFGELVELKIGLTGGVVDYLGTAYAIDARPGFKPGSRRFDFKRNAEGTTWWCDAGAGSSASKRTGNRFLRLTGTPQNPMTVSFVKIRPSKTTDLLNGKDLSGWKRFAGNPKQELSKFLVTPAGELHVTNGPGDLQTEKSFKDFCLHLECKSNGKALNSGIFFRCLPGVYQQGYEAQIQNGFKDDDRTKPTDFGTGAIYRRIPTRRVVPNDNEWFALTVLAVGPRLRTWVNGYPTVDWFDERPANVNGRNGQKLDAGPISIQGHDPTTDLLFRNLRVAEIKAAP